MGDTQQVAATPAGNILLPDGGEVKFWSALFGSRQEIEAKLCWASPEHAEEDALANADKVKGRIAVVRRGLPQSAKKGTECTFGDKTRRCLQAGAVGIIIVNTEDAPLAPGGYASVKIPVVCVHLSSGKDLQDNMRVTLRFGMGKAATRIQGLMKMGVFKYASSKGSSDTRSGSAAEAPSRPRTAEMPLETRREEWPEGVHLKHYEPVGQLKRSEDAPLRVTRRRRGSDVRPMSPTSDDDGGLGSPTSSAWNASVGSPTSQVMIEDEGRLEGEGAGFEYESKAQLLHSGITHRDPVMRQLAAEQLPALCERRPVEGYVVERFLSLLDDGEWRVRRAVVDNLTSLCEVGDPAAIKAMIRRTWSDSSWTIRLGAIEVLGKIGNGKDPQILLALLGRMEDPEAARGGRFLVREAALNTLLRLGKGGENVRVVMHRLKDEPWAERKAALQALMMASNEVPCATDDQRHPQAPVRQGYPLQLNPIHVDSKLHEDEQDAENAALLALEPENLCLKNGYKPRQKQGVILPMQTNATWKPSPSGDGDWDAKVKFEVDGNGFDEGYWTENWGRHKTQTAESYMTAQLAVRIKAERKARETGVLVMPRSKKKKKAIPQDEFDLEEEANREREKVVLGVVPGIRDIRCTRLGEAPGTGVTRARGRPKFYADEVLPGSLNTEGRKTIHNSRKSQQASPPPPHPLSQSQPGLPLVVGASFSASLGTKDGAAHVQEMSGDGLSSSISAERVGAGDTAAPALASAAGGEQVLSKGTDELPGMVPVVEKSVQIAEGSSPRERGVSLSPSRKSISPRGRGAAKGPVARGDAKVSSDLPAMPEGDKSSMPLHPSAGEGGDEATSGLRAAMPKVGTQAETSPAGQGLNVSRRDALLKGAMQGSARNRWQRASHASRVIVHLGRVSSRASSRQEEDALASLAGMEDPQSPDQSRGTSPADQRRRKSSAAASPDQLRGRSPAAARFDDEGNFSPVPGSTPLKPQVRPGSREGRDGTESEYEGSHLLANRRWQMAAERVRTPSIGSPAASRPGSRLGLPEGRTSSPLVSRGGSRGGTPLKSPLNRRGSTFLGPDSGSRLEDGSSGSSMVGSPAGRRMRKMSSFAMDKAIPSQSYEQFVAGDGSSSSSRGGSPIARRGRSNTQYLDENSAGSALGNVDENSESIQLDTQLVNRRGTL